MPWGLSGGGPKKFLWDKPVMAIKRLMEVPCQVDPTVYVETAGDALIDAFVSYMSPDPREIYTRAFGKSIFCHIEGTAGRVFHLPTNPRTPYQRFALPLLRFLDVSTYWYFLAGIAADGVINWATMARKMTVCDPYKALHSGTGAVWVSAISDDGHYQGCDFWMGEGSPFGPVAPSGLLVPPGYSYAMAPRCTWESATGIVVPTAAHIKCTPVYLGGDPLYNPGVSILDTDATTPDIYGSSRPTIMFSKGKNRIDLGMGISAEWSYTGGVPLPYHEAFPSTSNSCFLGLYPPH